MDESMKRQSQVCEALEDRLFAIPRDRLSYRLEDQLHYRLNYRLEDRLNKQLVYRLRDRLNYRLRYRLKEVK